ncbi:hypothetical protein K443DRAFT_515374 [Laccaria amethystina LaAM-08-1]|uniref:Uncharacterized protein n=1 Tax=Laccaria amethystina LaAM-08-1 TaxID=1095629 RepID=A0A0C9Y347_9AGAR|nr:hypothetical protein K443DRAFT_515374 [Laccaria amethystina LaAM-08-1]
MQQWHPNCRNPSRSIFGERPFVVNCAALFSCPPLSSSTPFSFSWSRPEISLCIFSSPGHPFVSFGISRSICRSTAPSYPNPSCITDRTIDSHLPPESSTHLLIKMASKVILL